MVSFILRDDTLESGLISLSRQLQTPIAENTLLLPLDRGTGMIRGIQLEEGLYLRYSRICYNEDTEIIRLASPPGQLRIFNCTFLLTPGSLRLVKPYTQSVLPSASPSNLFLTRNDTRISVMIPAGVFSNTLELLFTREWLSTHLKGMEEKVKAIEDALMAEHPIQVLSENTGTADEGLLREIETELQQPQLPLLTLRARILLLLSNTTSRWPKEPAAQPAIRRNWHVQTMRLVEQRLVQSLEDMLPSQKQLAKEFALSESTLKRHFKAVYGKTMYDYYLEKKMELAKWLLQEKKISVSETAYSLGYEKVSAFISMFKKYHNILPGSLKHTHNRLNPA